MNSQRTKEWFNNESFWRELYPFIFSDKRILDAENEVDQVLELTKPKGKTILDLCCGPGRISIPLAKRGFTVTGVDKSVYLLDKARTRARTVKNKIEWIQSDMRDFIRPNTFHLVINMFTSFGFFNNKCEDITVLRNIFSSLRPGGKCLIDVMGKERLAKILQPTTSEELPDGTQLVQKHQIFDDWTRIRNEWILIRKGRAKSFRFHITIYSGQELKNLLELVGFGDVTLYGDFCGEAYGSDAQRLIALGIKSGS